MKSKEQVRSIVVVLFWILMVVLILTVLMSTVMKRSEAQSFISETSVLEVEVMSENTEPKSNDGSVIIEDKGATTTFAPLTSRPPVVVPDTDFGAVNQKKQQ